MFSKKDCVSDQIIVWRTLGSEVAGYESPYYAHGA